jgi:acetyl/propionyl-CoA carboxylase alpha subunit
MFDKILIANRGDRRSVATVAAKPHGLVRAAHAGDLDAVTSHV